MLWRQALTDGSQRRRVQMMYPAVDVLKSSFTLRLTRGTLPAATQPAVNEPQLHTKQNNQREKLYTRLTESATEEVK